MCQHFRASFIKWNKFILYPFSVTKLRRRKVPFRKLKILQHFTQYPFFTLSFSPFLIQTLKIFSIWFQYLQQLFSIEFFPHFRSVHIWGFQGIPISYISSLTISSWPLERSCVYIVINMNIPIIVMIIKWSLWEFFLAEIVIRKWTNGMYVVLHQQF